MNAHVQSVERFELLSTLDSFDQKDASSSSPSADFIESGFTKIGNKYFAKISSAATKHLFQAVSDLSQGTQEKFFISPESTAAIKKVTRDIPLNPPREHFEVLQEWEGVVENVSDTSFGAVLIDKTRNQTDPEEWATIELDDVSEKEANLVVPGAIFRMIVGYAINASGTKSKAVQIVFRRLPAWRQEHVDAARVKAEQQLSRLRFE